MISVLDLRHLRSKIDLMNYPAASSGVSKFHRLGESQAQQAAGNMTPKRFNGIRQI